MASSGIAARGTLIKMGDGASPENFTTIAEVVKIGALNLKAEPIDITNHSSTAGWREIVTGLLEGGELPLAMNYLPADNTQNAALGLAAAFANRTKKNFQLIFPNIGNTTWSFAAYVAAFKPDAPVDGKLGLEVTLHITGQPTLA